MGVRAVNMCSALVFVLGWGAGIVMVLFMDRIEPLLGEIGSTNPVFTLLVSSPGISSILLVCRHHGVEGLKSFFRRVTLWRMPSPWWALLVLGIPAVCSIGAIQQDGLDDPWLASPWHAVFPA